MESFNLFCFFCHVPLPRGTYLSNVHVIHLVKPFHDSIAIVFAYPYWYHIGLKVVTTSLFLSINNRWLHLNQQIWIACIGITAIYGINFLQVYPLT